MTKCIFTFWEPKEKLPAYLNLCMQTWKKFLPDYEIVMLDYSNINQYLDEDLIDEFFIKHFSLPKQADVIRCFLLQKYGGIWLDTDTIITNNRIQDLLSINADLVLVGNHLAFIKANSSSSIMYNWRDEIENRIKIAKKFYSNPFNCVFNRELYKNIKSFDYLGNGILDNLTMETNDKDFYSIDKFAINAFPEFKIDDHQTIKPTKRYKYFYFKTNIPDLALQNSGGIICLHNSWTPKEYIAMDEEEFLNQNNTLTNVIKSILEL
jgi:hypothetical protein